MKTTLALFDFDGTMIQGDSIASLVRYLYEKRLISTPLLSRIMFSTLKWKLGLMPVEDVKTLSLSALVSLGLQEREQLCQNFVKDKLVPRLYQDAVKRMREHAEQGHIVLLVSASPLLYLQFMKDHLPVNAVLATASNEKLEVHTNVVRDEKNRQIIAWLKKEGLEPDWASSYAYGDTANDLNMLGMVGQPTLVNPEAKALRKGKGMPVVRWK